jgi:hypothetical protein
MNNFGDGIRKRARTAASPDEQSALRSGLRNIVVPQSEPRKDLSRSRRSEKDNVAACDRRILEFPLSMSPNAVAKTLKAEGWYCPKTTVYYIEFRIRRLREKRGRPSTPIQP